MVNTKKSRNAGRGPAPATTLSKLIKKLNEENQPPGGWYELRATSERRATSVKLKKATSDERRASSLKKLRATSDERQANGASSNKR
jgi:hypothetical protein